MQLTTITAKPILKWAGGKSQLIEQITDRLPIELQLGKIYRYIEPFIGGGALFFHIAQMYDVEEFFISGVNEELILVYKSIQKDINSLINLLKGMDRKYHRLTPNRQEEYFYAVRFQMNKKRPLMDFTHYNESWLERAAQIIFLNRTCFNGLFRVNSKGEFNVPFGRYKNPLICFENNLTSVSELLQHTEIRLGDFNECESFVDSNTFVYFDPPYRPISKTARFTSYSKYDFNDAAQLRLASFYRLLHRKGAKLMLSNSDPSGTTLIEAKLLNRNAIGYDINQKAVDITEERLSFKVDNNTTQTVAIGDVRNLSELQDNSIDLIVTHPPYANIVTYSDRKNPDDLSSLSGIPKFLDQLELGIKELFRVLKPDRYCGVLIGSTRKGQHYVPLSYFVLERCLRNGFALKEEIIKTQHNTKYAQRWKDKAKHFQFYLIMHEHLFVFRKPKPNEDLSRIRYSILK